MHPDDLFDADRAEELDERTIADELDALAREYPGQQLIVPVHAPDWSFPAPKPGMTRRSLGWARTSQVPPRHTSRRDRAGMLMLQLALWVLLMVSAMLLLGMIVALALL